MPDADEPGLLEGLTTTRAIRRFRPEPVPDEVLNRILFAATRAPSGSNAQPARFLVLRDGPRAVEARQALASSFRRHWHRQQQTLYRYDQAPAGSRSARMGEVMEAFVTGLAAVPVLILVAADFGPGHEWGPRDGGSIYPAVQNLLLAARALGYGGVVSHWHRDADGELRRILAIPDHAYLFATVALGKPVGHHGPVRRRPLGEVVFEGGWGRPAPWAADPPGTRFTGGPRPHEAPAG